MPVFMMGSLTGHVMYAFCGVYALLVDSMVDSMDSDGQSGLLHCEKQKGLITNEG